MDIIAWIGLSQSVFAAVLMFNKKNSSLSDRILSGWLILLAFEFMICGLDYQIFGQPLLSGSFLLFNPALYLYISSLTKPRFKLQPVQLLHLLPYVIFEVYIYSIEEKFSLDTFFMHDKYFIFRVIFAASTFISWFVYNPLSIVLVHKHRMNLQNERSNIEKNENLGWVLAFTVFYVVFCIFAVIITVIAFYKQMNPLTPHIYNYATLLLLVYIMSFYGLRQEAPEITFPKEGNNRIPYKNSNLSTEDKQNIEKKIYQFIEAKKGYLNPDLNMELLAEKIKIPKYQITEVLSTEIGKNFFQFVNYYRVEAVKVMLLDPKNYYSIEAIGYECGFSSKSTFYTVFKSMTGETPVSYRSKVK